MDVKSLSSAAKTAGGFERDDGEFAVKKQLFFFAPPAPHPLTRELFICVLRLRLLLLLVKAVPVRTFLRPLLRVNPERVTAREGS